MNNETTAHYDEVRAFMLHAGQGTPEALTMPDDATRLLRARLLLEEVIETIHGLGCYVLRAGSGPNGAEVVLSAHRRPDLVEIADGCADVAVVATGTLIACGMPDAALMALVDANNLAKFGPGHTIRDDGKLVKPPDHRPPDIAALLKSF